MKRLKQGLTLGVMLGYALSIGIVAQAEEPKKAQQTQQLQDTLKLQLLQEIDKLNYAASKKDYQSLVNSLPPKFIEAIAIEGHTTVEALRQQFIAVIKGHAALNPNDLQLELQQENLTVTTLPSGVAYSVIPLKRVDKKGTTISTVIALHEDNKWHFLYGGPKVFQNPVFLKVYPFLQDLKLAPEKWIKAPAKL